MKSKPWLVWVIGLILIVGAFLGVRRLWRRIVRESHAEQAQLTALASPLTPAATARGAQASTTAPGGAIATPAATGIGATSHPRLYFSAADIPALRDRARTSHQAIWQPLQAYAASLMGTVPRTNIFSRRNLDTYRDYGDQLITLAFVCVITGSDSDCELARNYLLTFATWDQWGDKGERGLGLSHMLQGNALAYDWLYDRLTPDERQRVRDSLAGWAQKMYEASAATQVVPQWNNWWYASYVQNHYFVANSALGIAGLALLGDDSRAPTWVDQASAQMARAQSLLNGIGDGSWHEGMSYQAYALATSLPFLTNLRRIQGTDLLANDYLQQYAEWRLYNDLPGTTQFILAFGDFEWTFLEPKSPLLLRFIAGEYHDGKAEWMAQELLAAGKRDASARSLAWQVLEFLYFDPAVKPQAPAQLEPARVFPDLEGVIWRTGWSADDLVFGLKAGPYAGRFAFDTFVKQLYPWQGPCQQTGCQLNVGHDHADANTFYLWRAGSWLAPEVAAYAKNATSAHNTLLIDGQGQYWPKESDRRDPQFLIGSDAFLAATADTAHFDYVAANATRPYRGIRGLTDFTRYVVFVRPDYFIMLDNLAASSPHQYEWISHLGGEVSVDGNWVRGDAPGGQTLGIGVMAPQPMAVQTGNDGEPYVRIRPTDRVANVRFIQALYPTSAAQWSSRPSLTVLDDNGQAAAIRVQMNDGSGRTDDIVIAYGAPGAAITVGPYRLDGRVAVIRRGSGDKLQALFVYGGTFLQDQARNVTLADHLVPTEPFDRSFDR